MNSRKQTLETRLDIELLYNKGRKNAIVNQQHNKNIINLLKYAHILFNDLNNAPVKNGQLYSRYHKLFKNLRQKLYAEICLIGEQNGQMGQAVRKTINQIIQQLSSKARRYEQGEKRIKELGKIHIESEEQNAEQEERVKEEMLQLIQLFKNHAVQMGKDLEKDNSVIDNITNKQQKVFKQLQKQTKSVKELNKSNPLGFFKLIGYSAIAIALWLFTLVFIIIF